MRIAHGIARALSSRSYREQQYRKRLWPWVTRLYGNVAYVGIANETERILCFARDRAVTKRLLMYGHYQKDDLLTAIAIVEAAGATLGGCFVDVGANIGTQTIYALNSGRFARALCLEPEPENLRLLRANLLLNGLEARGDIRSVAASDAAGVVTFALSPDNFGDHRVVRGASDAQPPEQHGESQRRTVEVTCARLDDVLEDAGIAGSDVSMVWVDTQGHEGYVLAGAERLLQGPTPFVIEFWPYALRRAGGLELLLRELKRHFAFYYDLGQGRAATRQPIATVDALVERLPGSGDYTDLILTK